MPFPIELQPRDIELLRTLFECRIMSLAQASKLFFAGRDETAKKRVQKLKAAGLMRERKRAPFERSVLCLSAAGVSLLRTRGLLLTYKDFAFDASKRTQVSDATVAHELAVMDIRVAFVQAAKARPNSEIVEFGTWPLLFEFAAEIRSSQGWTRSQTVRPDGFFRIQETHGSEVSEQSFFLELDRSTETQERLAQRCAAYQSFYRTGGFARWFGAPPEDYKDFPFRVLVVLQNAERRNNLLHFCLLQKVPIHQLVWTSTADAVAKDPFGPAWVCPVDFARAVEGTRFDPLRLSAGPFRSYRRQAERELLVESRARKRSLLDFPAA